MANACAPDNEENELIMGLLPTLHPDAALLLRNRGLLARNAAMENNVGRRVRFVLKDGWKPSLGTAVRDCTFVIGGVQRVYDGSVAYRVFEERQGAPDNFGRPARPDEIQFLD